MMDLCKIYSRGRHLIYLDTVKLLHITYPDAMNTLQWICLHYPGTQQYLDQGSNDESGHYSKTVSTILQQQRPSQWT